MDDIERIKDASSIETVVAKLGYKFDRDHGLSRRVSHVGGLVVNVKEGTYFWASKGWNGDVVDFVMRHEGLEFKDAIDWLAGLAGIERPNWGKVDHAAIKAERVKANVFDIAQRVFARWLQDDPVALAYVRQRGLTDKTIAESRIGFSGWGTAVFYKDMSGEFALYGVDVTDPAAVAVLGYRGDVAAWANKYNLPTSEMDDKWIERGHISGMLSTPGVVYAHYIGKRLVYFSRRHLPGHDRITNEDGTEREWKSWNPPRAVLGERQFYFNHAWRADAQECLIVEGQMDAITLAQWSMPAVALCGLGNNQEATAMLKQKMSKHLVVYLALDADDPGQEKVRKLGTQLGPLTRIVRWPDVHREQEDEISEGDEPRDELYSQALETAQSAIADGKKVTVSMIQRALRIGYGRAVRLHTQVLAELESIDAPSAEEQAEETQHDEQ